MEQVHSNIGAVAQITKSVIVQGEQAVLVRTVPFGYWRFDSFGHHLRNREEVNPARLITLKPQVRILLPLQGAKRGFNFGKAQTEVPKRDVMSAYLRVQRKVLV